VKRRDGELTALRDTTYLGSHPAASGQASGIDLVFTTEGVVIARGRREIGGIEWSSITALEADDREALDRRITGTRVLLLGAFALLARKETVVSFLIISDQRGDWMFATPGLNAIELRAGLIRLQRYVTKSAEPTVELTAPMPPPSLARASDDPAARLERLADLLERGLIDQREFAERRLAIIADL
jgi:hypothetical protein